MSKKQFQREYNQFNSQEIIGKIEYIRSKHRGVAFKIEEYKNEFIFHPYTNVINGFHLFYNIAERGDSIIKGSFSDTLILIKNNNVYYYTFEKPNK